MTVCVGAICREGNDLYVVAAADRMLSEERTQTGFEPSTPKLVPLSTAIGMMWAGDTAFQREIVIGVYEEVRGRIAADEKNWWLVSDVAEVCQKHYNAARMRSAVQKILAPRGYTLAQFREAQAKLPDGLGKELDHEVARHEVPYVQFLFAGLDAKGAHLYVVDNGDIRCFDTEGFCAIGVGASQAEAHFMAAAYSPITELAQTVLHAYFAKKRGEAALGVGRDATDMFSVGPIMGTFETFQPTDVASLEAIYRKRVEADRRATTAAAVKIGGVIEQMKQRKIAAQPVLGPIHPMAGYTERVANAVAALTAANIGNEFMPPANVDPRQANK